MALIISSITAAILTLLCLFSAKQNKHCFIFPMLMFWSASLMWLVDGFFCLAEGEPFLDISVNDTILGFVIVVSGLAAWGIYYFYNNRKLKLTNR